MELFVPGRICLFGEHSDWAGGYRRANSELEKGYTLLTGTNQGIYARVKPHPGKLILHSSLPDGRKIGPYEIPMSREALLAEAEKGGFFSYIAGVAYQVMTFYPVKGLEIDNYLTDLPVKKGLSSSAAVCVLTARAFNKVYDLRMTIRGEMEFAYLGEVITPSRCGRMDQGCAYGNRPILMTHDRDLLTVEELSVPRDLHLVVVDLAAGKNTKEILASLNRSFPFAESELDKGVQYYLGEVNKLVTGEATELLKAGDAKGLGELMTKAQGLFDRYLTPACPGQLTAPVLHEALAFADIRDLVWGGKGVGSQGDGSAQFVARGKEEQDQIIQLFEKKKGLRALKLDIPAARRARKALIPAAGFGTRLFPATKATRKELFPVIGEDGVARPAILYLVEEALASGASGVCIVVQKEDVGLFESFFNAPLEIGHYNKLSLAARSYQTRLMEIGSKTTILAQEHQEGLGHAVHTAGEWIGQEPFLLMLGDHLYRSQTAVPCSRQLLDIYEKHQKNVIGLRKTHESLIGRFGTVAGLWDPNEKGLLNITEIAEKPSLDYARDKLRVDGLAGDEYLTIFGLYVLSPSVFEVLKEHISQNLRRKGEFDLTLALDVLRAEEGFLGYLIEGDRFDIGLPLSYLETLKNFAG
ncbi:MAG: GHMP kinase [Candidatus Glassbacteria bacterium RIFCSPLOWO2_12_FULL_58_11]|uniref:UTP--glucose-1-phosphate uridylyltransferase n=1 Tax=Candidatus Glassbacteria bacterium RIFCSPLOWO2_12_FULL_58_11 TaxID=1817867 RepID=A0A1F5YYX2_9BACT|nr:MAG: GHMP kinase [Candidatus Glassbacteria bacterium RIFCSPLOWO2_12_FULL_58_11]